MLDMIWEEGSGLIITSARPSQSFRSLTHATPEQLALCPGLGDIKVRRLSDAFSLPFKVSAEQRATPRKRDKSGSGKSKTALLSGGRVVPPIEPGQMSLRESVERARSVSSTPAPTASAVRDARGREPSEAIDVDEGPEDGVAGAPEPERHPRPAAYSPEWPEDAGVDAAAAADVLDTSHSLLETVTAETARAGEKRVWHDPLESDDSEAEEDADASVAHKKRKAAG